MLEELCTRIQHCCAMLRWSRELLSEKFDRFQTLHNNTQQYPTTCNRVCKRTQHVTSNHVGGCWPTMLRPFARGLMQRPWVRILLKTRGGGGNNLLIYLRITLYCSCELNCANTHFKCRYDHRIYHSRVKMSSTNWAAPNIRVLIANLIEHCRANAETMGSNPAEEPKFFIGLIYNCIFV